MPKHKIKTKLPPTPSELEEMVQQEFFGFGESGPPLSLLNPFYAVDDKTLQEPHKYLLEFICNPDNFYFTCKYVFNVELAPFQLAVLRCLWNYKYPMLIGSRGMSKSFLLGLYALLRAMINQGCKIIIVGAGFRQAKVVFDYCDAIWSNAPVFQSLIGNSKPKRLPDKFSFDIGDSSIQALPIGDGSKIRGQRAHYLISDEFACLDKNTLVETSIGLIRISDCINKDIFCLNKDGAFEKPEYFIRTPLTDVYEIKTMGRYSFKCSDKHQVMTTKGWKLAKNLTTNDYLIFSNQYKFPTSSPISSDVAWLFGVFISEGSINHSSQMQVTNTDLDFINRVRKFFSKGAFHTKEAYVDNRGRNCKTVYNFSVHDKELRTIFYNLGLDFSTCLDKRIPWSVLQSSRDVVLRFFSGLFEGDGSCFLWKDRNVQRIGVAYYTGSYQLAQEVQVVLFKLGYFSTIQIRDSKISDNLNYIVRLNGKHAFDFANELNISKWENVINECFEKSNNKERSIKNSLKVSSVTKLAYQDNLYDFSLPVTNSFYGNCFVQHNSMSESIYENVISGFASTNLSPVEQAKYEARVRVLKRQGFWDQTMEEEQSGFTGNQSIISGTAYYDFNHFSKYWKRYKTFIESQGDMSYITNKIGISPDKLDKNFDYRDYCVIRIPVELLPPGFMDDKHIARARLTVASWEFAMEYGSVFALDSNNFYKRSLIESCVTNQPIELPSGPVSFSAVIYGNPRCDYVFGVDPASESDNFSIVVLELHSDHRRIVYSWTTTRQKFKEQQEKGLISEHDFYGYAARRIRSLMKVFPCLRIVLDSQGGGVAVEEALHDKDKLQEGELPIWPIRVEDNPKDTDDKPGLHILELITFSIAQWVREANHGMRKDFEDKVLLFPQMDTVSLAEAAVEDVKTGRVYDTLEDCVMEIEDLKDELATIVHTQTPTSGRDHWDTPEVKLAGKKKGRLRKDRYTALLMANSVARKIQRYEEPTSYSSTGGFVGSVAKQSGQLYQYGPEWFIKSINTVGKSYGKIVNKSSS